MEVKRGFTLIELLVVIAVIAILLGVLLPALGRAKEAGKRAACLSNLKNLTIAWNMYADENDDKLCSGRLASPSNGAPAWCGDAQPTFTQAQQEAAISNGALFRYAKNISVYRCPTAVRGAYESYSIVDGMNGEGADLSAAEKSLKGVLCKSRTDIRGASSRLVFLDEAYITPSSYAIRYAREYWWDAPTVRHGVGDTFAFADSHAEYRKWSGQNTVQLGKIRDLDKNSSNWQLNAESTPKGPDDQRDLQFMQRGCYGRLGYTPSQF